MVKPNNAWILLQLKSDIRGRCRLSMATRIPNLVKISQTAPELWTFSLFQDGGRPPSWNLLQVKSDVTACCGLSNVHVYHSAKFGDNISNGSRVIVIFRFSKRRPSAILGFAVAKNDIRGRCGLSMATSIPNLVKIPQMAAELLTFSFFQDGGRPTPWILLQVKNDVTARWGLSMSTIVPNLVTITQTAAELLRFSVFQNGGRPPSWILL